MTLVLRHRFRAGYLLGAILAAWLAASFIAERTTLHPARSYPVRTPAAMGMAFRDVAFPTTGGLTLRGWWIPGSARATIVMVHGLSSSREEPLSRAAYLHAAGYDLLVFDLRGHGLSDGDGATMGYREPDDVRAAVTEARRVSTGPIALFGYSMGASAVVEEAAADSRVGAVIEDSGFGSAGDEFVSRFSLVTRLPAIPLAAAVIAFAQLDVGTSLWNVSPSSAAAQLRRPLLAIVGDADTVVPPAEGRAIFAAAAGPKELLEVHGAGHVQAYYADNRAYESTVLAFLARSI